MYLLRSEFTVSPLRLEEAIAYNRSLFEHARTHPGHRGGVVLCSRGQPTVFQRGTTWDDESALKAFWQSPEFRAWIEANPIGDLMTLTRPMDAWETVEFRQEPGTATFAVSIEWTVDAGKGPAFEESRREAIAIRHRFGRGVVSSALCRYRGDPRRYLSYLSALSEADSGAWLESPEYQAWREQHFSAYNSTPPQIEVADVVYVAAPVTV